jgi:cyclic lactone autoinducer peptide
MKKLSRKLFTIAAGILTLIAYTVTANACIVLYYQPEVPEALREE